MTQDNMSALSGLASFAKLEELLKARSQEGSTEATLTFEAFEVELGHAMRSLENGSVIQVMLRLSSNCSGR
jgi:hypothetical protein